jgi:hypothetical protein
MVDMINLLKIKYLIFCIFIYIYIDISDILHQALSNITDGVCHTLKVRIEKVLNTESDPITLYSISNLIRFYHSTLLQVLSIIIQ